MLICVRTCRSQQVSSNESRALHLQVFNQSRSREPSHVGAREAAGASWAPDGAGSMSIGRSDSDAQLRLAEPRKTGGTRVNNRPRFSAMHGARV
jgi:hypothetical protein